MSQVGASKFIHSFM